MSSLPKLGPVGSSHFTPGASSAVALHFFADVERGRFTHCSSFLKYSRGVANHPKRGQERWEPRGNVTYTHPTRVHRSSEQEVKKMKRDDLTEALRFPRVTLLLQNPHIIRVRPLIPTQLFFRFVFFSTGGRRQADHTSKTTAQNGKTTRTGGT